MLADSPKRRSSVSSADATLAGRDDAPRTTERLDRDSNKSSQTADPKLEESAIPEDKITEAIERALDIDQWNENPRNPRNWSPARKWSSLAVVSLYTFVSPLASSMLAPGLPEIADKYGMTNSTLIALTLTVFLLAYAVGPLLLSPLSEIYGRQWVLHGSNLFFLAFNLGCAFATSGSMLTGFRFLAGLGASAPIAIGGGVVGDIFSERDRAAAMAIFSMGPLIGPVIGPIAGGFVSETVGVKWVFIIITCVAGIASALGIPILKESYAPILRVKYAVRDGHDKEKAMNIVSPNGTLSKGQILWTNLSRPMVLLFQSFILFILSLYMAIQYGFLYLLFTAYPTIFPSLYGWSAGIDGMAYIGIGVGFLTSTIIGATLSNTLYLKMVEKNNGVGKPEFRIPSMFVGSALVPIGLFWFGWSAEAKIHWIMPIIGGGIFACGMMFTYLPIQLYLVDAFTYAASAMGAAAVLRSLFGFFFPLFGQQMFDRLGYGGAFSLLAGISLLIGVPFPIWVFYYGERVRAKSPLNR
ncbi:MFS general substrate transporter [Sistotremastrum niveocremeum HHB9708]|uniref:MFS general substrate transporter n=1 Tax=Sistotremastrum niveocremeum HHB9708 TaxID=1314777 RepID=A0A164VRS2_9AGAM|nr:MFS general substrate transporter [Sistotremastrum niveocremeum HHB9708]